MKKILLFPDAYFYNWGTANGILYDNYDIYHISATIKRTTTGQNLHNLAAEKIVYVDYRWVVCQAKKKYGQITKNFAH